jgi:hypothetical protein
MVWACVISSAFLAAYALFVPPLPLVVIAGVLMIGGFFRSLMFSSNNAIAYADVNKADMTRASTLVNVCQQLALATGVAVGAAVVEATIALRSGPQIVAQDFGPAFILMGAISMAAVFIYWRLPDNAGQSLATRTSRIRTAEQTAEAEAAETSRDARDQRL